MVEEGKVREFARAVQDTAASETSGNLVPPTFAISSAQWSNRGDQFFRELGLDPSMTLHGEQEFEYLRDLRIGEELVLNVSVTAVEQKAGRRGGQMTLVELTTEIRDTSGRIVQRMWQRVIQPTQPMVS